MMWYKGEFREQRDGTFSPAWGTPRFRNAFLMEVAPE